MDLKTVVISLVTLLILGIVFYYVIGDYLPPEGESCNEGETCVRFCCFESKTCENQSHFNIHDVMEQLNKSEIIEDLDKNFKVLKGKTCENAYEEEASWRFIENGHINDTYDDDSPDFTPVHWDEYCIGDDHKVHYCFPDDAKTKIQRDYPYFMFASVPFLIITFCVYGALRELRNLHGKCLMCYVLSLTMLYSSLASVRIWHQELLEDHKIGCSVLGYTFLASLLMCFFWLNAMCFDIYTTFRRGMTIDNMRRFFMYCCYAFGAPLTITIIAILLNVFEVLPEKYRTQIGIKSCMPSSSEENENDAEFIYIYLPLIITLTVNIVFYSVTAYKIYRVQQEATSGFQGADSKRHAKKDIDKMRFFLYLRLFVIMGILWSIEAISWWAGVNLLLYVVSILNCMQGFIIFVLFVWKSKVKKLLARKYTTFTAKRTSLKVASSINTASDNLENTKYNLVRFSANSQTASIPIPPANDTSLPLIQKN